MNLFVPGIPIKRYLPSIDPQQTQIPMVLKGLKVRKGKVEAYNYKCNTTYYSEYKNIIEDYIDKEAYNENIY